jgi:putative ABC transport system permease protein
MRHLPTILRQVRRSSKQAGLFVLCVSLSLATLTAVSGLARSIGEALQSDARRLHAADIIVRSDAPISAHLDRAIGRLVKKGAIKRADVYEFYSMVRAPNGKTAVLARLKVVQSGYPFYGRVVLQSGRPFKKALVPGTCIVARTLLDRTGLSVGDKLKVGYATLKITDVVTAEPDRPLELFSFGPRVFINAADLKALGLMATGSRIRRFVLIKVLRPHRVDSIAARLKRASAGDTARIDTYLTAGSAVKRFLDNFLFFLKLVGLFILLIAGMGIQSTLTALFNEKHHTIAVMKAVGATGRFITVHFMMLVLLLGAGGGAAGLAAGAVLQAGLAWMLAPFLPAGLNLGISPSGMAEAVMLGTAVVALFSFLPLYRLREMRPVAIFNRRPAIAAKRWPGYLSGALILLFFLALVLWHMRDMRFGLYFVGAVVGMILAAALLAQLVLGTIKRLPVRRLALRQAVKGLFRRGNATRAIVMTLTVSLTVIFGDQLIERNLNAVFVQSFPADAPNAFFVDIQPDQTEAFAAAVGGPVQFYPIVRARVVSVNGNPIDRQRQRRKRGDNLSRIFNLTYRKTLLRDERLIDGDSLFRRDWKGPQVSVMDTVAKMRAMKIGDRITFNIQGVPLTARIASIRTRTDRSISPFFYFVFPPSVLKKAPHTLFAALRVPPGRMGALQNKIAVRFPNISVIDLSQTLAALVRLMDRLARILRLFGLFSVAAGLLILISAVFATRAERVVETVYYKILGARRRFVIRVFALENLLIGLFAGALAIGMAQAGAYWVCTRKLDIGYRPFLPFSLLMVALTVFLVVAVGLSASRSIMVKKPVTYLREQQNG